MPTYTNQLSQNEPKTVWAHWLYKNYANKTAESN